MVHLLCSGRLTNIPLLPPDPSSLHLYTSVHLLAALLDVRQRDDLVMIEARTRFMPADFHRPLFRDSDFPYDISDSRALEIME
jgi:hypothetical protein